MADDLSRALTPRLRACRLSAGWTATALAAAVGLSRQAYAAIEAGRSVPATDTALRLARALGTSVEALFALAEPAAARPAGGRTRAVDVGGRLVQVPLAPSHGLVGGGRGRAVVVAGCDPATPVLGARLARAELLWTPCGSAAALQRLARGEVHVAGSHLTDTEAMVAAVVPFPCEIVHVAVWQQGLVVAPGNPLGLVDAADLARARVVNRELGSGSRRLLEGRLRAAGVPTDAVAGWSTEAPGHLAVADAVAAGLADAGVAVRAAAAARGLGFVGWVEEAYRLVVPRHLADDEGVAELLVALRQPGTRAEFESLGGYDGEGMGCAA
jgi:molybdate-binding protein/DNA-binding XRE family transcriptional regulator